MTRADPFHFVFRKQCLCDILQRTYSAIGACSGKFSAVMRLTNISPNTQGANALLIFREEPLSCKESNNNQQNT